MSIVAGTGGRGQGQGRGQDQGDDCADLQDLDLKGGRECTQQHGPGARFINLFDIFCTPRPVAL